MRSFTASSIDSTSLHCPEDNDVETNDGGQSFSSHHHLEHTVCGIPRDLACLRLRLVKAVVHVINAFVDAIIGLVSGMVNASAIRHWRTGSCEKDAAREKNRCEQEPPFLIGVRHYKNTYLRLTVKSVFELKLWEVASAPVGIII